MHRPKIWCCRHHALMHILNRFYFRLALVWSLRQSDCSRRILDTFLVHVQVHFKEIQCLETTPGTIFALSRNIWDIHCKSMCWLHWRANTATATTQHISCRALLHGLTAPPASSITALSQETYKQKKCTLLIWGYEYQQYVDHKSKRPFNQKVPAKRDNKSVSSPLLFVFGFLLNLP